MIYAGISRYLAALVALLLALIVGYCLATLKARVSFQFMTVSVLLDGLEVGDYSLRGRRHRDDHSLDGVVVQINRLAEELALLLEGAIVTAQVSRNPKAAQIAKRATKALIEKAVPQKR